MIQIEKMTIEYTQEADDFASGEPQILEVSTEDAGGGKYFVIKTDRWAVNDFEELINIFEDFKARLNLSKEENGNNK